jgi:hypothetical protein
MTTTPSAAATTLPELIRRRRSAPVHAPFRPGSSNQAKSSWSSLRPIRTASPNVYAATGSDVKVTVRAG